MAAAWRAAASKLDGFGTTLDMQNGELLDSQYASGCTEFMDFIWFDHWINLVVATTCGAMVLFPVSTNWHIYLACSEIASWCTALWRSTAFLWIFLACRLNFKPATFALGLGGQGGWKTHGSKELKETDLEEVSRSTLTSSSHDLVSGNRSQVLLTAS